MLQSCPSKELWPGGDKLQTQFCTLAPPPTQVHGALVVSQAYHRPGQGGVPPGALKLTSFCRGLGPQGGQGI